MTKRSLSKQRKRKSNKDAFETEEEYKRFAEKRNAATKRCRQGILIINYKIIDYLFNYLIN